MGQNPEKTGKRPRIVVCALETYSQIGGLQNFNRRVFQSLGTRAQLADGTPPKVVISGDDPALLPASSEIEFISFKRRRLFLFHAVWAALRADVLILCYVKLAILAPIMRLFRPQLPILMFVHGIEVWSRPRGFSPHVLDGLALGAVTRFASVSKFTAEIMSRLYGVPLEKFRILPNAVDPVACAPGQAARENATILCVSRLQAHDRGKNVDLLIKAAAALRERAPDVKLEIIGDGSLRPELEALAARLGVSDRIIFHGHVNEDALRDAYARATVFAMPSSKEGFGIVYLEAWLRGLPVICSTEGASSEVVSDGVDGFAVNPADEQEIVERLALLLTQPEFASAMGEKGRQKVLLNYLDENFRCNLNNILDELIADGPHPIECRKASAVVKDDPHALQNGEFNAVPQVSDAG